MSFLLTLCVHLCKHVLPRIHGFLHNKGCAFLTNSPLWKLQCPNLPTIGYAQSILTRDSQGRDSFTEDTLLSAWD